jgi:tryptophanyl-tRNA synthetase
MARIISGIKPTGTPHLGNYLGMIRPALDLAVHHDAHYFVADYHALNLGPDPSELRRRTHEVAATFLALGLDPARTALYRQSDVPEICALATILGAVTPKGLLNRAHAYKAAVDGNRAAGRSDDAGVNMGLFSYPLLMAADVLGPRAEMVPVGSDQSQHLEIARDIAAAVNARHPGLLTVPDAVVDDRTMTVVGTDGRKMSKSYGNVIPILAPVDELERAVMSIVTDSRPAAEPKDPDGDLVFRLFSLLAPAQETAALRARYLAGGLRYVDAKRGLLRVLDVTFRRPRERFAALMAEPGRIEASLAAGAQRVRPLAAHTLAAVHAAAGLGR